MGVLAGLAGGAGAGGLAAPPGFRGRSGVERIEEQQRLREAPIDPVQFAIQQRQHTIRTSGTAQPGGPGSKFVFQRPKFVSRFTPNQSASKGNDLSQLLQGLFGGSGQRNGRASFLGAGNKPQGARSFPSLLRSF